MKQMISGFTLHTSQATTRMVTGIVCAMAVLLIPQLLNAQLAESDGIQSADIAATLHADGRLDVTERIRYDIGSEERIGFIRRLQIPQEGSITVTGVDRDGLEESYRSMQSGQTKRVMMGSQDIPLSGEHQYEISYEIDGVIQTNNSRTQLHWPVLFGGSVEAENITVSLRSDADISAASCRVGAGEIGCPVEKITDGVRARVQSLPANSSLVIRAEVPDEFIPADIQADSGGWSYWLILIVVGVLLVAGGGLLYWWRTHHADTEDGPVTPERIHSLEKK